MNIQERARILADLRVSYLERRSAIAESKRQITESHKESVKREIQAITDREDRKFAGKIREALDAKIRVTWIMDEVLKSRAWSGWTKWRDLANTLRAETVEEEWF